MVIAAEETTVDLDGRRVRIRVRGDGRSVLLLNGLGAPLETWRPLVGRLTGMRTIAFDTLGSGRSQSPRGPLSIAGHARLALRLLDHLGCGTVSAVGFSFGGMVAQELARLAPHRVDRLVLASTSCGWGGIPGPASLLPAQVARLLGLALVVAGTRPATASAGSGDDRPADPERVADRHRLGHVHQFWAAATWSSAPWLHRIGQPTLVVTGSADLVVPAANARILASLLPDARVHVVDGGGHLCLLDRPDETVPLLRTFLSA